MCVKKAPKGCGKAGKRMKKNLMEVIFAFDCGVAAAVHMDSAIKSLKGFILAQRKLDGEMNASGVAYNSRITPVFDNIPVGKLVVKNYGFEEGGLGECRMLDATAHLMNSVGARLNDTPEEQRPSKVVCVINVIGRDNASKKYTYDKLRDMIALQRDVYKWQFYLITDFSINMEKLGISPDDTFILRRDEKDATLAQAYKELNERVTELRGEL